MRWLGGNKIALASAAVVVLAWEGLVRIYHVPAFILPPPTAVIRALVRGLSVASITARDGYYVHAAYTLAESMLGFAIGSVLGVLLAVVLSQSRFLERAVMPHLLAIQSLPRIAVAPLLVTWFGFGMTSKVILVALVSFFPLLVNTLSGLRNCDTALLELMESLSATRWQIFRWVQLPHSLPFVFAGLELALVFSVLAALVGEFVGAQRGLGLLMLQMNFALDVAGVFAVFVILALLVIGLTALLHLVRKQLIFWAPSERRDTANRPHLYGR